MTLSGAMIANAAKVFADVDGVIAVVPAESETD